MAESAERELLAIEVELAEQIGPERLELLKEILALPWSAQERERRDLRGSLQSANSSTNMDK